MASYQDLLDAIARVREATGDADSWRDGLSGNDIAVACSPTSPPGAIGAVVAKIVAGHADVFRPPPGQPETPPRANEGASADAIRAAETALAQQYSTVAQVDLQVVSAVLNAHAANVDGAAELERLQREVEAAVLARTDLDTPAGAREFQRFLIGKVRDIRSVVDAAGLDATSRAALAAALTSLYVSSAPEPSTPESAAVQPGSVPSLAGPDRSTRGRGAVLDRADEADWPVFPGAEGLPELVSFPPEQLVEPAEQPVSAPTPLPAWAPHSMATPPLPPDAGWGAPMPAGLVSGLPNGGGFAQPPSTRGESGSGLDAGEWLRNRLADWIDGEFDTADETESDQLPASTEEQDPATGQAEQAGQTGEAGPTGEAEMVDEVDQSAAVRLPDGDTVIAPTPQLAAVIGAAVSGTSIPDAFRQQGITLPPPGSPVSAALDAARLLPGDIGAYADRYALVLGNGKALVDSQIRSTATVFGPGFLGWLEPPVPKPVTTPEVPATNGSAQTAPS